MAHLDLPRLKEILHSVSSLNIALVGDLFLDRYLEIQADVHEVSLETGLEAYQVERIRNAPGALGTVMNNLTALGVRRLFPVTVIGDDGHGYDLCRALEPLPVEMSGIIPDASRVTPTYTKPLRPGEDGHWHELNRLDIRPRGPMAETLSDQVCRQIESLIGHVDGFIVLDQVVEPDWGVVNSRVRRYLAELAESHADMLLFVDSRAHLKSFLYGVLKGNQSELLAAAGMQPSDDPQRAAERLCERTGRPVFCTMGERGIAIARPGHSPTLVPAAAVTGSIDIVGAGDAATSGLVTSLLVGADELEAAAVANLVASVTVRKLGTTGTASPDEVVARWREIHGA